MVGNEVVWGDIRFMRDESYNIDVTQMNRWELTSRMSGFSVWVVIFVFNVCAICSVFLFPEMLNIIWLDIIFIILAVIAFLCAKCIYKEYNKIGRILNNATVLRTKIIKAETVYIGGRDYNPDYFYKLSKGDVFISCTYFDEVEGKQYLFEGYYDLPPYSKNVLYRQGKSLKDLKEIYVLVNYNNYEEYVILLKEKLCNLELY